MACFSERRNAVFEIHQRIEDTHLDEARAWERNLERKRAKASNRWRAKMHCMQTVAEGRMADIERRKYDRNKKAQARKKAQVIKGTDNLLPHNIWLHNRDTLQNAKTYYYNFVVLGLSSRNRVILLVLNPWNLTKVYGGDADEAQLLGSGCIVKCTCFLLEITRLIKTQPGDLAIAGAGRVIIRAFEREGNPLMTAAKYWSFQTPPLVRIYQL